MQISNCSLWKLYIGDWTDDRSLRIVMSHLCIEKNLVSSRLSRPWQHVIEPVHGYLKLAEKLVQKWKKLFRPWNFGPNKINLSVLNLAKLGKKSAY